MTQLADHRTLLASAVAGPADGAALVAATTRAAHAWVDRLTLDQQRRALFPFASAERGDWHYAPRRRGGMALRDMDARQRGAAYALLEGALSAQGGAKAHAIMALETVLGELEAGRGPLRDPLNYAFSLFGRPDIHPWGWRVEGHHLIVNVTVAGPDAIAITPTFWGTNPARIPQGPRTGERVMAREYLLALELARTLSADQRDTALLAERSLGNIVTERGRAQALQRPEGIGFAALGHGQRDLLMTLVHEHVGNAADALARPYLTRVQTDGLDALHLAWAGGMAEGEAFYYRIHAPRLLIEFDCTQNDANHIHSIWRDPSNDWGRDILGEHYRRHHDHD